MSYKDEFETIELLRNSDAITKGVDSFCLSLIKAERQMRKLTTFLIFQSPCFFDKDIKELRSTLESNRRVYFEGFERGFDAIYYKSVRDLIGEDYDLLKGQVVESIRHRNKIFHGQLTSQNLTQLDLFNYVDSISKWCELLAKSSLEEIGYDGFGRNSFRKNTVPIKLKYRISNIQEYSDFLAQEVQRQ